MSPRRLLFLLPLLFACASAPTPFVPVATAPAASAASAASEADRVVWVRVASGGANATVVLTGAPVQVVAGAYRQRGDTLFTRMPFAVSLPDSALDLQITARGAARGASAVARVEYSTVDALGQLHRVEGEGTQLMLRRLAPGQQLLLGRGAESVVKLASTARE